MISSDSRSSFLTTSSKAAGRVGRELLGQRSLGLLGPSVGLNIPYKKPRTVRTSVLLWAETPAPTIRRVSVALGPPSASTLVITDLSHSVITSLPRRGTEHERDHFAAGPDHEPADPATSPNCALDLDVELSEIFEGEWNDVDDVQCPS